MSVFARYKRNADGFRKLVELWESTPVTRRQKMIEVGRAEDSYFVDQVLSYMMTFEDILKMSDFELAELTAVAPGRTIAFALHGADELTRERFIKNAKPQIGAEIRDCLKMKIGPREIGGAQLKLVEKARELERKGLIQTKKIPIG